MKWFYVTGIRAVNAAAWIIDNSFLNMAFERLRYLPSLTAISYGLAGTLLLALLLNYAPKPAAMPLAVARATNIQKAPDQTQAKAQAGNLPSASGYQPIAEPATAVLPGLEAPKLKAAPPVNNNYDYGWCTWHVANRRAQIGFPIPQNWGNAVNWRHQARQAGYVVDESPQQGAIAYAKSIGSQGHVAFVEEVTPEGIRISEMNNPSWATVSSQFVPASEYSQYAFIY